MGWKNPGCTDLSRKTVGDTPVQASCQTNYIGPAGLGWAGLAAEFFEKPPPSVCSTDTLREALRRQAGCGLGGGGGAADRGHA